MIREGTSVRCQGKYRGQPCGRFLGVFTLVYGGIKCSRCGHWNALAIEDKVDGLTPAVVS